jgi:hypothetical protein
MDSTHLLSLLMSTDVPRLPDLDVLRWARRLSWGVVLAGLGLLLLRRRWPRSPRLAQLGWVGLMLVSVCLPGEWTPSFWLGLAFQSPSLTSTVLLTWMSLMLLWPSHVHPPDAAQWQGLRWASFVAIAFGWVLLLDTFALLPLSFYIFGFSPAAVSAVALLAVLPWVLGSGRAAWGAVCALVVGVLFLHVVLRLPSGNVWDALLDPWLWIVLHVLVFWKIPRVSASNGP